MDMRMNTKVCFVATVEIAVKAFLVDHIRAMSAEYDVTVVTDTDDVDFLKSFDLSVAVVPLSIKRRISLLRDVVALRQLYSLFKKNRFTLIHSIMPKSGLLSMIAGFLARVPIRLHTFTGQVWATRRGLSRRTLKLADRLIACFATQVFVDSHSQRDFLIGQGVVTESKSHVIGNGSICGVDTTRFSPSPSQRKMVREVLGIPESDTVFLFVGRLTMEKGLLDLARAFVRVCMGRGNAHLVIVGPDEQDMRRKILSVCTECEDRVHFENYTKVPQDYMAAADVFCLPSYREGFGSVVIEAAGCEVPSIGTRIYGVIDAIVEDVTGLLYEPGNVDQLSMKMIHLMANPDARKEMGRRARERVLRDFSREMVVSGMLACYESFMRTRRPSEIRN